MDRLKEKITNDKIFYVGLSISSGLFFSYIFKKYEEKRKSKEQHNDLDLRLPDKKISKITSTSQFSMNFQKAMSKSESQDFSGLMTPGAKMKKMKIKLPTEIKDSKNTLLDELKFLTGAVCEVMKVGHLAWNLEINEFPNIVSPLLGQSKYRTVYGGEGFLPDESFIFLNSFVLSTANFGPNNSIREAKRWLRAGPRKHNFFLPEEVKAAIVTCGGLCPGLNVVIRELVMSLSYNYKVKEIYGIQFGYRGFYTHDWVQLFPQSIKAIHKLGGTTLGSSRGGFDLPKIIEALKKKGINHVYIIGGDGTHRGIKELYEEISNQKLKIAICGLPKTIDNDIPIIDKSFGFETAIEEAVKAIQSAYIESHCAEYGVGIVRLMGRYAGFIALEASSASRDVNICLVPEFKYNLNGKNGLLEYIAHRLQVKRHCVIVLAEGAGKQLKIIIFILDLIGEAMLDEVLPNAGKDASGNIKAGDIGNFLKNKLTDYCKKLNIDATIKYIDPTYMIRTVPANSYDKKLCSQLAQNATHGCMAGFTGFSVGHVNNKTVFIPIDEIVSKNYANKILPCDRTWQRLLASTGQPSFINDEDQLVEKE